MKISLVERSALVTGGTRGIGAAVAALFLQSGARVTVSGRDESHFTQLCERLPADLCSRVKFLPIDFSDAEATAAWCEARGRESYDILVNNAGINKIDLVGEIAVEDFDRIQRVNVRAPALLMRALAPGMATRGYGRIVNLTSVFGIVSKPRRASYSASKFALAGFSRALALDYAAKGVLCNCVAPGFIDTELTRAVLKAEEIEVLVRQVPVGRLGRPEEVANLILYLASSENSFMTGQNIVVDGGFTSA